MSDDILAPPGDSPVDCGTCFLCVAGCFARDQVSVAWTDEAWHPAADVQPLIDDAWQRAVDNATGSGADLFDGPLVRLDRCAVDGGRLCLATRPTGYRHFVGTNRANAVLRFQHGPEVLADPLGTSGLVVTTDGLLMMGRRSHRVVEYPGSVHPFGGCMEPDGSGGAPDPFHAALKELAEETGIGPQRVSAIVCIGMVRDKLTYQPELVFDITVALDAAATRHSAASADDAHEHTELVEVRDDPVEVARYIETNIRDLTPVTPGALLLHGRRAWGHDWYAATLASLKSHA